MSATDPEQARPDAQTLVSVVVPCHDGERFLAATLASVLAQTHRRLELIVVDDASRDGSVAIVERLAAADPRVRLLRLPHNSGSPAAPRNAGVAAARGEWIAFLDADDLWHPRKLELQLQALRDTGMAMCSTGMRDFTDDAGIRFDDVPAVLPQQRVSWHQQLVKYRTPTSSIVVRRDCMLRCPFNEDRRYRAREDTDCFIRMHEHIGQSLKLPLALVAYRQQPRQISGNKWRMVGRHLAMLRRYRRLDGRGLGLRAYLYTATHFAASLYLRAWRGTL